MPQKTPFDSLMGGPASQRSGMGGMVMPRGGQPVPSMPPAQPMQSPGPPVPVPAQRPQGAGKFSRPVAGTGSPDLDAAMGGGQQPDDRMRETLRAQLEQAAQMLQQAHRDQSVSPKLRDATVEYANGLAMEAERMGMGDLVEEVLAKHGSVSTNEFAGEEDAQPTK